MRLAIFSAFPHEIERLLRDLRPVEKYESHSLPLYFARYRSKELVIVQTGMGAANTEAALNYVFKDFRPNLLISAGFGGALYDGASAVILSAASGSSSSPPVSRVDGGPAVQNRIRRR